MFFTCEHRALEYCYGVYAGLEPSLRLQIGGKESDGASVAGTVRLVLEAGAWRVESVST